MGFFLFGCEFLVSSSFIFVFHLKLFFLLHFYSANIIYAASVQVPCRGLTIPRAMPVRGISAPDRFNQTGQLCGGDGARLNLTHPYPRLGGWVGGLHPHPRTHLEPTPGVENLIIIETHRKSKESLEEPKIVCWHRHQNSGQSLDSWQDALQALCDI